MGKKYEISITSGFNAPTAPAKHSAIELFADPTYGVFHLMS